MSSTYTRDRQAYQGNLLLRASVIVKRLPELFERDGHIDPMFFTWAVEPVEVEGVKRPRGTFFFELNTTPKARWSEAMRKMIERTKASGLLLVEQRPEAVVAIYESTEGSQSWLLRVVRKGDRCVLDPPEIHQNRESVGLLWSAAKGQS